MKKKTTIGLSVFICFVFIQSLFFKFTNAPETQHIFGVLDRWSTDAFGISNLFINGGVFNAYIIGSIELVTAIFIIGGLITRFKFLTPLGALMAMSVITGAIFFHIVTPLGIVVQDDGGTLFGMAVGVWFASLALITIHKDKLINLSCNLFCHKANT